ncbi:MAG: YhdH/YhfP family quinone oxidoreductase [Deferrisomatales bacterium]|nr:YhdH/YhfP family quinone oxidoreductase [Deferrisomatales bacterium]
MTPKAFPALVVSETPEKTYVTAVQERRLDELPPGDVLVRVSYSSVNYKDVLSCTGNRGVTRRYPHTPGIDAAGVVAESTDIRFREGDPVIVTSYDLGMNTPGGYGRYIRVPGDWVVPLPEGLTLRESMIYGTAGFTAALSVHRLLQEGLDPAAGDLLVSGATGGVGSIALSLLAKGGYRVTAVNGVVDEADYLRELGAREILSIEEAADRSGKPLLPARWAGAVDTVGGEILATAVKSTAPWGRVTCCGNIASHELPLNVYPFILRGVTLLGIDSQNCPMPLRRTVWGRIAGEWKIPWLDRITTETSLEGLPEHVERVLQRRNRGRTVVRLPE